MKAKNYQFTRKFYQQFKNEYTMDLKRIEKGKNIIYMKNQIHMMNGILIFS